MNIANSLPSTVTSIGFSFLTSQDIRRISVKQIVNPVLLDDLNRPSIGGLYDPALGPSDRSDMWVREFLFSSIGSASSLVAQLVISHIIPVLDTMVILSFLRQYSIHYSWETCIIFCEDVVCSAIVLRWIGQRQVVTAWILGLSLTFTSYANIWQNFGYWSEGCWKQRRV